MTDPKIIMRPREPGEPNRYFPKKPDVCPNCGSPNPEWILVFAGPQGKTWNCQTCDYNVGVLYDEKAKF